MMNAKYAWRLVLAMVGMLHIHLPTFAVEIDGFTEPYRTVEVAAPEMGIITAVKVRVGDHVNKGDVVVTLDDDIHHLLAESALARKDARGRYDSALAELKLRQTRHAKLKEVVARGHGRSEEVERAKTDIEIAAANVLMVDDDIRLRALEHRRLVQELERRKVRSPLDGIVSQNLREVGEFVAPIDPRVVTIVQLDQLLAKFSLRRSRAEHLEIGDVLPVRFPNLTEAVAGTVEEISPVIDAESGTIRVKLKVENADGKLRSGQRCALELPDIMRGEDFDRSGVTQAGSKSNSGELAFGANRVRGNSVPYAGPGQGP